MNFLFYFLLVGLIVASLQDLKRREVDNWLNLLLIAGGFSWLVFTSIFYDANYLIRGSIIFLGLLLFIVFVLYSNEEEYINKKYPKTKKYLLIVFINLIVLIFIVGLYIIFRFDMSLIISASISLGIMFVLANLFYYSRVFAGGDAKLLLALFPLFVSPMLGKMLIDIGLFSILLMVAGSIYGIGFGLVMFVI
ncbi:MAG: hypothetical protein ACP5D2_04160, partial [Candidatus Nanoarchaeia archaeon]